MSQAYWEPPGLPRGTVLAEYPLRTETRYRVSHSPDKSHYLHPQQDHAFCGLELAPDVDWLIESGYEAHFWIVVDNRKADSNKCAPCGKWKARHFLGKKRGSPADGDISEEEWKTLHPKLKAQRLQLEAQAAMIADMLDAQVVA